MTVLSLVTYNVLAPTYALPRYYPRTLPDDLDPGIRLARLRGSVESFGADVICLQEMEDLWFRSLLSLLAPRGYRGRLLLKSGERPDGCATFVRGEAGFEDHRYDDGPSSSGHVALLASLPLSGRRIVIANTHLKWDPPGTPREARWGWRQVRELIARKREGDSWILCGDLNVSPDDEVVAHLGASGFHDPDGARSGGETCVANGRARRIDYILHTAGLRVTTLPLRPLTAESALPSADEPSDHLPLRATIEAATSGPSARPRVP